MVLDELLQVLRCMFVFKQIDDGYRHHWTMTRMDAAMVSCEILQRLGRRGAN